MRYMIDIYGNVDLGTLDWHISGTNFYAYEFSNNIKKPKDNDTIANIYCNLYRAVPLNAPFVEGDMALDVSGRLYIRDTRYTTTAEFKEAMRGQILRYELETPANGGYLPMYKGRYKVSDVCQLLDKSKYPGVITKAGVTTTSNGDGSITINGTATASSYINCTPPYPQKNNGHVFYIYANNTTIGVSTFRYGLLNQRGLYDTGGGVIGKTDASKETSTGIVFVKDVVFNNVIIKPQIIDLTEMYGAGNEPTTVEEFRQKYPNELYPYSPYCWAKMKNLIYKDDIEYIKMK